MAEMLDFSIRIIGWRTLMRLYCSGA